MGQQLLLTNPVSVLVWGAGLWFLLRDPRGARFRALGWTYLLLVGIMLALHGKDYYLAPAYPMLFAAGGVAWELWTAARARWLRPALVTAIAATGCVFAPLVVPVLPPGRFLEYQEALGVKRQPTEVGHSGPLPQHFGDMFGWPEMVEKVAQVYNGLPPEDRAKAAIYSGNYGEAAAIDLLGSRYGLPKAISGHETYYLWGPRNYTGEVIVVVGDHNPASARKRCASVEIGPEVGHPYAMAKNISGCSRAAG